jgi:hypothetical protein
VTIQAASGLPEFDIAAPELRRMVKPFLKVALSFEEKQPDGSCGDALVGLTASWAR